jgi:hypothetical protein
LDLDPSDEELEELFAPQLRNFSATAHRQMTVNSLVQQWIRFVTKVEKGYDLTIYDYHNDLDTRGLIERLIVGGPEAAANKIRQRVEPWDRRFEAATTEVPYVVATFDIGPWARRVPINPGDELAGDLVDSLAEWQQNQRTT